MKMNEMGPVGHGRCACSADAKGSKKKKRKKLQRKLLGSRALLRNRADFTEQLAGAFEIRTCFLNIAVQAAEHTVFEICVCLSVRIPAPAADFNCLLEERNTVRVGSQAEDLT